jgi:hypothetical protein
MKAWSEYGFRPHEVFDMLELKHYNYSMQDFISDLNEDIDEVIYRYISRESVDYLSPGDVFETHVPTSWTGDIQVVMNMTDGFEMEEFYILQLDDGAIGGYNYWNIYGEHEYIVRPMKLEVIDVTEVTDGDVTLPIARVRLTYR